MDEHRRLCARHGANFSGKRDPVHLGHLVIEKCHVEGIALYDPFGGRARTPYAADTPHQQWWTTVGRLR
jgi:hypothetical protein